MTSHMKTTNSYQKGAHRSIDAILTAAEKLRLSDDETLELLRVYRERLQGMVESGDNEQPFIDRAVNESLRTLLQKSVT